jgi:hypothetical protein
MIIAIDPGNKDSAFVIMDETTYKPIEFNKIDNLVLAKILSTFIQGYKIETCVIEMIYSYGTGVGKTIFETCVYIGRLVQICFENNVEVEFLPRATIKAHICHSSKAGDSNINAELRNRFGGKGDKANPGFFHGFAYDVWSAFAIGTTYLDRVNNYEYIPKFKVEK